MSPASRRNSTLRCTRAPARVSTHRWERQRAAPAAPDDRREGEDRRSGQLGASVWLTEDLVGPRSVPFSVEMISSLRNWSAWGGVIATPTPVGRLGPERWPGSSSWFLREHGPQVGSDLLVDDAVGQVGDLGKDSTQSSGRAQCSCSRRVQEDLARGFGRSAQLIAEAASRLPGSRVSLAIELPVVEVSAGMPRPSGTADHCDGRRSVGILRD